MQITIDTAKDSPDEIRKAIELLKGCIGEKDEPGLEKETAKAIAPLGNKQEDYVQLDEMPPKKERHLFKIRLGKDEDDEPKDVFGNAMKKHDQKSKKMDDEEDDSVKIIPY